MTSQPAFDLTKGRYHLHKGSDSSHCCFACSVIDTQPQKNHGPLNDYRLDFENGIPQFEAVCECMNEDDAQRICDALNRFTQ